MEENSDVPEWLRGREDRFGYVLDRDGVDAGFSDYWDLVGEEGEEEE